VNVDINGVLGVWLRIHEGKAGLMWVDNKRLGLAQHYVLCYNKILLCRNERCWLSDIWSLDLLSSLYVYVKNGVLDDTFIRRTR
jgi:hypothetical protein